MSEAYLEAWADMDHLPSMFGLKSLVANLSVISGLPCDQLRFALTLLMFVPMGWAFRLVRGTTAKHLTNLILGVVFTYFIVGPSSANIFVSSTITYILVAALMPSSAHLKKIEDADALAKAKAEIKRKRQRLGAIIFVFAMGYMCVSHIYRLYVDYLGYHIDFTAPQMMLTLKLVSFAWQRVDGEILKDGERLDDLGKEEEHRTTRAIREMPSLLEYYGWIYHFTSVVAGPSLDYYDYASFIDESAWRKHGLTEMPYTYKAALYKLLCTVLVYPGMLLAGMFPISGYVSTDAFYKDYPTMFGRVLYVAFFNGFARYKYYFAWYLAEAGCVAQGVAMSGYNKETRVAEFEGCNNCRAWAVETCTSTNDLINNWNIRVSMWLKHMVYMRVSLPNFLKGKIAEKNFASMITKFTSAFWHGFYPGYYIFFFQVWFIQTFETKIRALLLPYFSRPNPENPRRPILEFPRAYIYNVIMNVFTLWSLNWLGSSFVILELWPSLAILWDSYFFYHVIGLTLLVFLPALLKGKSKKGKKVVEGDTQCQVQQVADNCDVAKVDKSVVTKKKTPKA